MNLYAKMFDLNQLPDSKENDPYTRPPLRGYFAGYMNRQIHRYICDYNKGDGNIRNPFNVVSYNEATDESMIQLDMLERIETLASIQSVIDLMTEDERRVYICFYVLDMSADETAELMNKSVSYIHRLNRSAIKRICKSLGVRRGD